jgi:hypothetical protein
MLPSHFFYQHTYKKKILEIFKGKNFNRINFFNKLIQCFLFTFIAIIFIILIIVGIRTKFNNEILSLYILPFLFLNTEKAYVGDDIIVYNNIVFRLNKIKKCEKEDTKLGIPAGIRIWINEENYFIKIRGVFNREKFIKILNNSKLNMIAN